MECEIKRMKNIMFDILIFLKVEIPTIEILFEKQHDYFSLNSRDHFLPITAFYILQTDEIVLSSFIFIDKVPEQ